MLVRASGSLQVSDHYQALGVGRDASMADIKKAYRKLARELHPDVAGDDQAKLARFKRVSEAYEVIGDPIERGRYDRRFMKRTPGRMAGGFTPWSTDDRPGDPGSFRDPANELDLEDIFGQKQKFDFGFGGRPGRHEASTSTPAARPKGPGGSSPPPPRPEPPREPARGADIPMGVDVPRSVAAVGGTVTLNYKRRVQTEDLRGVVEIDEIHDLRVPPGVRDGQSLRVPRWGHAGEAGGPYGDLVCDLRLVGAEPAPEPVRRSAGQDSEKGPRVLDISIQEALLGGRVELDTPQGRVALNLPPCTSGGARFRLRGKGEVDPKTHLARDLVVQLRIVTPPLLDAESEELIRRFAALNQLNPRD
jgi:curved DNA-binding protein